MRTARSRTHAAALAAAAALLASGCGGSSPLKETADNLSEIKRGTISLRFSLNPAGAKRGVALRLSGPFSLAGGGSLPVARIAYLQHAGGTRRATFISTGRQAFVSTAGRTVRLGSDRLAGLRIGSGEKRSLEDLGLHVDQWIKDPKTTDGPRRDGQRTEQITGTLNAAKALGDLRAASGRASGLSAADTERLARTVSSSSVKILTGKEDHLLRRLRLSVSLSVPPELRPKLGGNVGLRIALTFGISKLNRPVRVSVPAGAPRLP